MASAPIFTGSARVQITQISTANTNRNGSGTIGTAWMAGASGSRIEAITITATGTTTDGRVRLYVHDGSTAYLWKEVVVTALTPSGTVSAFTETIDCVDDHANILVLQSGYSLRASTHNAETFNVIVVGGDY